MKRISERGKSEMEERERGVGFGSSEFLKGRGDSVIE